MEQIIGVLATVVDVSMEHWIEQIICQMSCLCLCYQT